VTATGTIRRVPRKPNELPDAQVRKLLAAARAVDDAQGKLKAAVREALTHGSVRQVAAALGISPTTVHAWSKETP